MEEPSKRPLRSAAFVLVLATIFASFIRAQDAPTGDNVFQSAPTGPEAFTKRDILSLTPEALRAAGPEAVVRWAQAAYASRHYEEAARAYTELASMRPGVAVYLYDLACCYGLMGRAEQAARFLKAAWTAGYRDLDHIERDPDFMRVRTSVIFQAQVEELRKDAARRDERKGRLLLIEAPAIQRVTVLDAQGFKREGRYTLVIGLHGAGATAESAATVDFLRRLGGRPGTWSYAGGHVIRPEVVEKVAGWIAGAAASSGDGPGSGPERPSPAP